MPCARRRSHRRTAARSRFRPPGDQRSLNDTRDPAGRRPPPGRCPPAALHPADGSDFARRPAASRRRVLGPRIADQRHAHAASPVLAFPPPDTTPRGPSNPLEPGESNAAHVWSDVRARTLPRARTQRRHARRWNEADAAVGERLLLGECRDAESVRPARRPTAGQQRPAARRQVGGRAGGRRAGSRHVSAPRCPRRPVLARAAAPSPDTPDAGRPQPERSRVREIVERVGLGGAQRPLLLHGGRTMGWPWSPRRTRLNASRTTYGRPVCSIFGAGQPRPSRLAAPARRRRRCARSTSVFARRAPDRRGPLARRRAHLRDSR